jgi:molecular chaperone DnaK
VIDKNQSIPTTGRKENYSTVKPNQTEVVTKVYQGESEIAEENELLDEFTLSGIEPAPAGEPNLGVEFELDQDGILNVEAIDFDRGETEDLQIEGVFGYDEGEIQDMKEELPQIQ